MSRHTVAYSFGAFDLKAASAAVSTTAPAVGPHADGACPDIHNEGGPPHNVIRVLVPGHRPDPDSDWR